VQSISHPLLLLNSLLAEFRSGLSDHVSGLPSGLSRNVSSLVLGYPGDMLTGLARATGDTSGLFLGHVLG
jgi:hypothetical protein